MVKWTIRVFTCLKEMGCFPALFLFLLIGIGAIVGFMLIIGGFMLYLTLIALYIFDPYIT